MIQNKLLMLFVRKPELGKVKTRLAQVIGAEKALDIYTKLLQHTHSVTKRIEADKRVYYAGDVDTNDLWENTFYQKRAQPEGDLGYRMEYAFSAAFQEGYKAVVIIGSDCLELNDQIITQAFDKLMNHDIVIGPARDGGYYLLGMKQLHTSLFREKEWSTDQVFSATLSDVQQQQLSYALLPLLSDIDRVEDLPASLLKV